MTVPTFKHAILGFLACLTGGLCGCGQSLDEVAGKGGTELPGPLQIVIVRPVGSNGSSTASLAGVQWRVWESNGSQLLVRGSTTSDTSGQITLPNQNGVWVLEGWHKNKPLQVPVKVTLNRAIPDTCLDSLASGQNVLPSHSCTEMFSPSQETASVAPAILSVVRLSNGLSPVRVRILNASGSLQAKPARARLWRLASADTLRFEGELTIEASGEVLMSRPLENSSYLLEAWSGTNTVADLVNETVPFAQVFPNGLSKYLDCLEMPVLPASGGTFSIHACPELGATPSLVGHTGTAPDLWGTFKLVP